MDYSTLPEDAESSPWSTSPRMTRRSDQQSSSDLSTGAYKTASSTDQLQSSTISDQQETLDNSGNGLLRNDHEDHQRSSSSDEPYQGPQASISEGAGTQARTDQKTQHQRYHTNAKGPGRTNLPQYRLQAKVTGLERTGRKDPILRFDVHVLSLEVDCLKSILILGCLLDQSTEIQSSTVSGCSSYTFRIHQIGRSSYLL